MDHTKFDLKIITLLLDHGADVNIQDNNDDTALSWFLRDCYPTQGKGFYKFYEIETLLLNAEYFVDESEEAIELSGNICASNDII